MRRLLGRGPTVGLVVVATGATAFAALLAVLRTAGPETRRGVELVAFTPTGLPLALLGLLAAVVLCTRLRRSGLLLGTVALLLTGLHGWWLAPLYGGALPRAAAGPQVVVMTQNFEEGDAEQVAALVREHDVDVLVLTDSPPHQVAAVAAAGVGRALPFTTLDNGLGSVIWSRFPIADDVAVSDGSDSRVVTLGVPGAAALRLVAVHPSPPYQDDGALWSADWSRLLAHLPTAAHGTSTAGAALVVGDFNATRDHAPMRAMAALGFRDVAEQLNRGLVTTWPANWRERRLGVPVPPLLHLDHVLTTTAVVPTDLVVSGAAGSDHRAVIATVTVTGG